MNKNSLPSRSPEGEPGDLRVGPRHGVTERPHRKALPGGRRLGEPAEALGRHAGQPEAPRGPVAQPAVSPAGQRHAEPQEEAAPPQ